ncbi:hypothetical protein AXF42_Ash012233 [Apostasia shenzhenica]|uniref:Uncharacterized protein n=1 Tax=Apostasia shenzhenica TaxID=1088818 RepID=A0A2I0B4B6_9ASPA|nr:hypothetical protein AXF42_Ash012233 [Apostasia shenzhenica]
MPLESENQPRATRAPRERAGKGNPYPERGSIKKEIAKDFSRAFAAIVGGGDRGQGKVEGGGGGGGGSGR